MATTNPKDWKFYRTDFLFCANGSQFSQYVNQKTYYNDATKFLKNVAGGNFKKDN